MDLGHRTDEVSIHPSEKHLQAIKRMPSLTNAHDLRAFLRAHNYYQRFIPNLQCTALPLQHLLKKKIIWSLKKMNEEIFMQVKSVLTSSETMMQ